MGPNPMTGVFIREKFITEGRRACQEEAGIRVILPQAKEHQRTDTSQLKL